MASTLLVTNDFGPRAGGIESFVIGLLERAPFGEVVVYTSAQQGSEDYDLRWHEQFGVRVIRDKAKILLPSPRVIRDLQKVIAQEGLNKVWFGAAAPLGLCARFLRKAGANHIVALTHGHEVWWSKLWPFTWIMNEIAKQVDYATHLGEFTRKAIAPRFKQEGKLVKIAPGIDTSHFAPKDGAELRKQFDLGDRPTLISVGRLVHRKGQDRLISALPIILQEVPDAVLVFVGEGPHRPVLDKLVAKHHLQNHVKFIGRVNFNELPMYIAMGDVFAMPSRSRLLGLEVEGLGIVYLEASACGLPVIGGASGGAPDAVLEGETGFVVDGNDLEQIASRCVELLKSPQLRADMGAKGRQWAVENWGWNLWSKKFNQLMRF